MNRWKLISGVVLVFVLGVLAGSMGTGFYFKHRLVPSKRDPRSRKAFIMEKLSRKLDLTQSQKIRIEKIVSKMVDRRREYFVKRRPEIRRIMDHGFSQIKKELNSDQQKKLDALREKFEKRRKAGA